MSVWGVVVGWRRGIFTGAGEIFILGGGGAGWTSRWATILLNFSDFPNIS